MENNKRYDNLVNQILTVEDKCIEINKIIKVLDIWIKENSYEMIPVINILKNKMTEMSETIRKCLLSK